MRPTQEQALDWAFECDFVESTPAEDVFSSIYVCCPKDIERLVTIAYEAGRKDENEACAKVAEERWLNKANCTPEQMYELQKKSIADAIRARGRE